MSQLTKNNPSMSLLFLEGSSHAPPSHQHEGKNTLSPRWLVECLCAGSDSTSALQVGREVDLRGVLGGSVRQDRGHSLVHRMPPHGVRWMMLHCGSLQHNS
ncbi:hypothetical protein CgunFtcFv8_027084 [Champsocephalus gunnari]|uniref:Uncharacterized protein n=2 Tax=Channichthyidae TaxID=30806 RepID=A0AAN8DX14_CHAGU|nr:hypothetical protein CgunFtcFv8_027084 [Champsocephalus gunnari]